MYSGGSKEFNQIISNSGGNALKARLVFDKFVVDSILRLDLYGGSNNSDNISIGTTQMAYIEVEAYTNKLIANRECLLEVGAELSDGTIEYAPVGYFTVQRPEVEDGLVKFTAFDRMQRLDVSYKSKLTFPSTVKAIVNEICGLCGITLATSVTDSTKISKVPKGYTCREIIGFMAGLSGKFACFDRYGKLNICWYSSTVVEKPANIVWSNTKPENASVIQKVTMAKESEIVYTSGSGSLGIEISNPFATQNICDSVYSKLKDYTYSAIEVEMLDDIRIDPWDVIAFTDIDETVYNVPVMALQHNFADGSTVVKAFSKSETESEYDYKGPTIEALNRMATELLVANQVIATKVDADWVKANTVTADKIEGIQAEIDTINANNITTDNLSTETAKLGYMSAEQADLKYANIETVNAIDGKVDNLSSKVITTDNISAKVGELGYLKADEADLGYAKIDFSNVGTQVVDSSMIKDGAVTNEKVANLSANKITSGTIDASKINVTNLNADNLTVGTINGQRIGDKSIDLDKLAKEVPTKEYLDKVEADLQGQIDGNIETFTKTEIPTLNNEPANTWIDDATKQKHIGDICYVINPTSSADGYCYRFADLGTSEEPNYAWVLIKDSDVTKALQDIITINGEITGIKKFDEDISSWQTSTNAELSSIKARTTTLETDIGNKVETSTFNTLKQTVDENTSNITKLSTDVSSTVETITNTVNEIKQTADSNTSTISSMQTTIDNKADDSTVTELSKSYTELSQTADFIGLKVEGIESDIGETNAKLELKVDHEELVSEINASADSIKLSVENLDAQINIINKSISSLVQDENGESLMTQTEEGWVFSMKSTIEKIQDLNNTVLDNEEIIQDQANDIDKLQSSLDGLDDLSSYISINKKVDKDGVGIPSLELGNSSTFKVEITNSEINFVDDGDIPASISNKMLRIDKADIENELSFGGFSFINRPSGNMGLIWKGDEE